MHDGRPSPPLLAGKYRLVERLGQGGMGAVWRAEHVQLRTAVAVKLMSPKMLESKSFRTRFEREARAAAQLKTRHVVTVHDYGVEADAPYIVMELLDGEDLASRLRRERRFVPAYAAVVVAQIARALDRAHAAGLVHRDLKPANVFLARLDDEEVVKVLDFGIAKETSSAVNDSLTGDDEILGTPTYMAPEQIRSLGAVDLRADLWSLGVIAYRLITGTLPFSGDTGGDLVVRVCTEPAVPPSRRDPSFGPTVDHFFERALAKDPAHRFSSAREMAAAFEVALGLAPAAHRGSYAEITSGPMSTGSYPNISAPLSARSSFADVPAALRPSPSFPALPPEPETSLSLMQSGRMDRPSILSRAHRRGVVIALGAVGLFASLTVLVVVLAIGAGGRTAPSAEASASQAPASPPPPTVTEAPTATPTATEAPAATSEPTAASATATPSATAPLLGSAWPASRKPKRRKVELGL